MPELNDMTALALLAGVLIMGNRWASRLADILSAHLARQAETQNSILEILRDIRESVRSS